MVQVGDHEIQPGARYQCNPEHRNGNREKSQWTISEQEERGVFSRTYTSGWIVEHVGWGLHIVNGSVNYLGVDRTRSQNLIVARFIDDNNVEIWHGYPADPNRRSQQARIKEIPPEEVQTEWLRGQILPKPKVRKLGRGEPCTL